MNDQTPFYIEKLSPEYILYQEVINMIATFMKSGEKMLILYHLKQTDTVEYATAVYTFISEAMLLFPIIKNFAIYVNKQYDLSNFFKKYESILTTVENDIYLNREKYNIYFLRQMYFDFIEALIKIGLLSPLVKVIPSKKHKIDQI
ncbi:MAG: hypothetical protein QXQ19_00480 [Candidatus Aenigmatarchaeota archaeon]